MKTRRSQSGRYGFTLIEMVVSLSVMSIVMMSLGSVVMIASRAVPNESEPVHAELELARLTGDLERDLTCCTGIKMQFETKVDFIEIDLGVLEVKLDLGLGKGGGGRDDSGTVLDSLTSTDLMAMEIVVPEGNDGLGASTVRYQFAQAKGQATRQVSGSVRDKDVYDVTISELELRRLDGEGHSLTIGFTHANGETSKTIVVMFRNSPSLSVS